MLFFKLCTTNIFTEYVLDNEAHRIIYTNGFGVGRIGRGDSVWANTTAAPYTSVRHSANTAWNAYKVLPKSAEKESGPGRPCMTNPSLTPSVPLSTSKDKSCIEYKHWILPRDNAKHLRWTHYETLRFQKSNYSAETGWSIMGCALGGKWRWDVETFFMLSENTSNGCKSIHTMQGDL